MAIRGRPGCVRTKEAGSHVLPRDQEDNTRQVAAVIFKCAGELRGQRTKWIGFQKWGVSLRGPQPRLAGASPATTPTVPKHPAERRSRLRMLRSGKVPRHTRRVPHAGGGTQGGPRIRTMGTCGGPTALRTKFPPEERGLLRTHS